MFHPWGFIYLLQYFCAASRGFAVVKPLVTSWWKVAQVYYNVSFLLCLDTTRRTQSFCFSSPPPCLNQTPSCFITVNPELSVTKPAATAALCFYLSVKMQKLLLGLFQGRIGLSPLKPSTVTFIISLILLSVPMLLQLFASLHTACSHCLLFCT